MEPGPIHGRSSSVAELAWLFLKLGTTAFGGPAAHIAMMEDEVVRRRQWLTRDEFLDLLGATNLIPGPNSTEMAIHVGHRRAGWLGWLTAGSCFILPAALIVTAIAWAYVHYGHLPQAEGLLYGIKPVIIAVVVQALWRLGQSALKTKVLSILGALAVVLNFWGINELAILFGAGLIMSLSRWSTFPSTQGSVLCMPGWKAGMPLLAVGGMATPAAVPFSLGSMFLVFIKIGSILFGSGYVLLAFLRADLVERCHWLTETQLLDAVAVGQFTPGPVFTTATFIGYLLAGVPGATLATLGIFLPAFFFVAVSGPLVPRLRRSAAAGLFLDGVNVASLALMAVVTWRLGQAALQDGLTAAMAGIAAFLLFRYRVNSAWLVAAGAVLGLVKVMVQ